MTNEIYHHGILGQKWGVRRYQNSDGSLKEAGRKRYSSKDYQVANQSLQSASNIARNASNIAAQSAARKKKKSVKDEDISKLSDQELQRRVNRMNLERNYKSLKSENVASGREYASSVLSTAGEVLAIGASAASILLAINSLKNK